MAWSEHTRSLGIQLLLSAAFGPLGLLYSSPVGGVSLFFLAVIVGLFTGGWGALVTWPLSIGFGIVTVRGHNRRLAERMALRAVTPRAAGPLVEQRA